MPKFKCKECKHNFTISVYRTLAIAGKTMLTMNDGDPISCPECKTIIPESVPHKKKVESGTPFSSKGKEAQKAIMKQRSKQHSQRNRFIE